MTGTKFLLFCIQLLLFLRTKATSVPVVFKDYGSLITEVSFLSVIIPLDIHILARQIDLLNEILDDANSRVSLF